MKKCAVLLIAAIVSIAAPSLTFADPIIFDRGLPAANLNDAAGASRSNVSWAVISPETGFTGDDFTIGSTGQQFLIDTLTVWGAQVALSEDVIDDPPQLGEDINNIWLYLGKAGDPLAMLSTGEVTGNSNSNPNITHTFVNYPDSTSFYEGNGGTHYGVARTTFSGLNLLVNGGVTYNFGVLGDSDMWWSHASNALLSGSTQQGADGRYLAFDTDNLSSVTVFDSNGDGWDKSSDINVQITGTTVTGGPVSPVPEPGSMMLLGSGLIAVVRKVRNRRLKK